MSDTADQGPTWSPPPDPQPGDAPLPLDDQIAELKRELAIRKSAYPSFVMRGRTTGEQADKSWRAMQAALRTLLFMQRHEAAIRSALAGTKPEPDARVEEQRRRDQPIPGEDTNAR